MRDELQVENGKFTRIANKILDDLIIASVSSSELRIILAVIRKTYGFQKSEDSISLTQLMGMTLISKRNVIYLLQNLEAKKLLIISREKEINKIRFNKYSDTWVVQNSAEQVKINRNRAKIASAKLREANIASAKLGKKLVQNSVKKVNSFAHTKEITKEITKESTERGSENKSIPLFIDLFKEINPTYRVMFGRPNQRDASERLLKLRPLEEWEKVIRFISSRRTDKYCPRISTPIQLEQKYGDLETYASTLKATADKAKNNIAFV